MCQLHPGWLSGNVRHRGVLSEVGAKLIHELRHDHAISGYAPFNAAMSGVNVAQSFSIAAAAAGDQSMSCLRSGKCRLKSAGEQRFRLPVQIISSISESRQSELCSLHVSVHIRAWS